MESLEELANLSEAAGLEVRSWGYSLLHGLVTARVPMQLLTFAWVQVVGFMQQHMDKTDPQTCLGSGKLAELMQRVNDTCAGEWPQVSTLMSLRWISSVK